MESRPAMATLALVVTIGALSEAACEGKHDLISVETEEGHAGPSLVSVVRMDDLNSSGQLLSGFYAIEDNAWRWTAGKFSVVLRTPPGAAQSGATLTLAFTVPEGLLEKFGNVTVTGYIHGAALKPAKYLKAGPDVYSANIPASLLAGDSIRIDFALDKSMPPGVDKRELGIIAGSVGLSSN
jgi:hypothetical protein